MRSSATVLALALCLAAPASAAPPAGPEDPAPPGLTAPAVPKPGAAPSPTAVEPAGPAPQDSPASATAQPPAGRVLEEPAAAESPAPLHETGEDPAGRPRFEGGLSLDQALGLGLARSLEVALGQTGVEVGKAMTAEAASLGRPKLSLGAYGNGGTSGMIWGGVPRVDPGFLTSLPNGALSLNAMLMVPVWNGGLFRHLLESAEQSERATVARAALAVREAARGIRAAYHRVLQAQALLAVARWELQEQQELVRLVREQFRLGKVARVTVQRAEAEAAAAGQVLAGREADLVEAETALKVAMGVSVTSRFAYSEPPPAAAAPGSLDDDLATALSDRPDLVAARYTVEARDREVGAALAEFSPQVYAVAMGERMQMDFVRAGPVGGGYQAGLAIGFPLYDGGERQARVDRVRAELATERLQLERMEQEATAQVVDARARLEAALRSVDLSEAQVAAATEQLRVARLRYQAGRAIFLEILDAVSALARARSDRATAAAEAGTAQANLLYATGRY